MRDSLAPTPAQQARQRVEQLRTQEYFALNVWWAVCNAAAAGDPDAIALKRDLEQRTAAWKAGRTSTTHAKERTA